MVKRKAHIEIISCYTIYLATHKVHTNFEDSGSRRSSEKLASDFFVREKENKTKKGSDEKYLADYLPHSTTGHTKASYQISKF